MKKLSKGTMPTRVYVAELFATFCLCLAITSALRANATEGVPLIASLTLALFVYMIGGISGAHLNPAVTIGLLSIQRIGTRDAIWYIGSQMLGAVLAIVVGSALAGGEVQTFVQNSMGVAVAEGVGAFFLVFGICSVVYEKVSPGASGFVVGGSLFLGILLATFYGANAFLNPAVATASNASTLAYMLGPVAGAILGAQVGKYMYSGK